jgi:hypothetical protein
MKFKCIDALLLFDIPKFHNAIDRSSGDLESSVEPEAFDDLIIMSLECGYTRGLFTADIPYFDEFVTRAGNKLFLFLGEI